MPVIALKLIDKYDAYVGRYAYLCGNENRERIDFVSIIMAKELIRVPRVLGESYNSVLIERLYEAGGNVMLDLIIYLGSYHLKDLFGTSWFSVEDFCRKMGYDRTNLQRKLDSRQLSAMFGKNMQPEYVCTDTAGQRISHPIETVFEAALYKLGLENLCYPTIGEDGRTSYNFVQILKRFDIMTDFKTKKSTKRLYSAVVSPEIKNFMFSLYNLLELQDYRSLPSRYRYFYLELSKMVYLIKYKTTKNKAPFYVLTVDQLAKKLGIEIAEPKDRKKKVASILKKMNTYLKYTNFNFSFVKGDHERWAYTVLFSFPRHTLHCFDEGQYAVVVKKFYKNLLGLYVEIAYPDTDMAVRRKKIKEVEEDAGLYKEFLLWANSPESVEKKKQIYISDFVAVFGRFPEGWAQEELESANGTEVAPAPEEFISPETDGAVNMDDPAV